MSVSLYAKSLIWSIAIAILIVELIRIVITVIKIKRRGNKMMICTSWDSINDDELTAMSCFLWEDIGRDNDVYDIKGNHTWAENYRCTNCGSIHSVIQDFGHYNFCPKCGTRLFRNER